MGSGFRRCSTVAVSVLACYGVVTGCTFPGFVALPDSAFAGAPNGVSGAGSSGQPAGGTATRPGGGNGGAAANASSGDTGEGGTPDPGVPPELGVCGARPHPKHCQNHQLDVDETDVDCGGPGCAGCAADETCAVRRDCATSACVAGKCERLFELTYMQHNPDLETTSLRLRAIAKYLGNDPVLLRDVAIRYYFSRNSVTEPLLPTGSSQQDPTGGDISSSTTWTVHRTLRGDGIDNDAYLEVAFTGGKVLSPGQSLDLTATVGLGDPHAGFNQSTHHSWDDLSSLHESKNLTVHLNGQRVWGRGPELDDPQSCLMQGVNLDGGPVTVGDEQWLASPDSVLDRYIDNLVALRPATDKGREEMLRTGFFFKDTSFDYPVANGSYALLVYVWSSNGGETGTLRVNDQAMDRFQALSFDGGGPWVALGPYRITIANAVLQLGAEGELRAGGFELRTLDE